MKNFLNRLKMLLPWVVAVLIFAYLFYEYKPGQILKAVKHANLAFFLVMGVVYFVVLYLVDCYTISKVLTRFGYPVSMRELFPARGATYLIMNINYPASQAAFAYYLKRTRQVPIFEVLGVFLFIAIVDLYILISLAFIGSFFQEAVVRGVDIKEYIRLVALVAYLILIVHLIFWRRWSSGLTGIKKEFKFVQWIRAKKIFCVFNEATIRDYLMVASIRSPIHASIVMFLYIAVMAFGAHIPFINVLGNVPIAFLIGTIPITPGGLGTTNVAMVELISPYMTGPLISQGIVTAGELILAVTILWMVVNYSFKTIVGVVWLQKVSKQLFKPTEQGDAEKGPSEITPPTGIL